MERLEPGYFERFMKRFGRSQDATLKLAIYDVFENRARLEFNVYDNSNDVWVMLIIHFKDVQDFICRQLAGYSIVLVQDINVALFDGVTYFDFQPFKDPSSIEGFEFRRDDFYCSDGMLSAASVAFQVLPVEIVDPVTQA